ncbi:hypothetical protein D3C79_49170 [compost metagenome]
MKITMFVLSLIPVVGMAAAAQQPSALSLDPTVNAAVQKTFVCQEYTDNAMTFTQGYTTDNPRVTMETRIEQTKYEFKFAKNDLLKEGLVLAIPEGGNISGVAGTQHEMMFKRVDGNGKPYFILYFADPDPKSDGEINRAVYVANCKRI